MYSAADSLPSVQASCAGKSRDCWRQARERTVEYVFKALNARAYRAKPRPGGAIGGRRHASERGRVDAPGAISPTVDRFPS
jgi:hypothetical protein